MLVHYCKSNVKLERSFQFVCLNSPGSKCGISFLHLGYNYGVQLERLNCLLWLSIRLFLFSQAFALHHSVHHLVLITFFREQNGTG